MSVAFHFAVLDYVILALVFFSLLMGFFRGFTREVISLITWFAAFYASITCLPMVSGWLTNSIPHETIRYIVSAITVFFAVLIIGMIINKIVCASVNATGAGFLNRLLGGIFGAGRGLLLVVILLLFITESPMRNATWFGQSQLSPYFQTAVAYFSGVLPKEIKQVSGMMDRIHSLQNEYHHPLSN